MTAYIERAAAQALTYTTDPPSYYKVDGTNAPAEGWSYDGTVDEQTFYEFVATAYASGNLTLDLYWYPRDATSDDVVWEAQIAALTPGASQSWETDAFATLNYVLDTSGGSKEVQKSTITISNLDGLTAGDMVRLRIARDANSTNDTDDMTGDAVLVRWVLSYADS